MTKNSERHHSSSTQARKQQMLVELQEELKLHHARKQRRRQRNSILASAAVLIVMAGAVLFSLRNQGHQPIAAPEVGSNNSNHGTSRLHQKFAFASLENNREEIRSRYLESRDQPKRQIERISDDELVGLLKTHDSPFFLAEIDGAKTLVPSRLQVNHESLSE